MPAPIIHTRESNADAARFVDDWIALVDGEAWYYTPFATRVRASDTQRVSDARAA